MSGIQTKNGKAFEFACLTALQGLLGKSFVQLYGTPDHTAEEKFNELDTVAIKNGKGYRAISKLSPNDDIPLIGDMPLGEKTPGSPAIFISSFTKEFAWLKATINGVVHVWRPVVRVRDNAAGFLDSADNNFTTCEYFVAN